MRRPNLYRSVLVLCFCGLAGVTASGQSEVITAQGNNSNAVTYHVTDAGAGSLMFMIYGDGYPRWYTGNTYSFQHGFSTASYTGHAIASQVFMYTPDRPPKKYLDAPSGYTQQGSGSGEPPLSMSGYVKVSLSWNTVAGEDHITVLTIQNPGDNSTALNGFLQFDYKGSELAVASSLIHNDWFTNESSTLLSGAPDQPTRLQWDFSGLQPGEQRHLYLFSTVNSEVSVNTTLSTVARVVKRTESGDQVVGSENSNPVTQLYALDPNNKTADRPTVCADHPEGQKIEYTVRFQNDGENFTNHIRVSDVLPPELNSGTVQFLSSSAPTCLMSLEEGALQFSMPYYPLPGLRDPHHTFSYDQTVGFVRFSVETDPCLAFGSAVINQAEVTFDDLAPLTTKQSVVLVDRSCTPSLCSTTAVEFPQESFGLEVKLFPNPARGASTLRIGNLGDAARHVRLAVFDALGRRQRPDDSFLLPPESSRDWPLSSTTWARGLYRVVVQTEDAVRAYVLMVED
jgi:uncharacterized repeat protein (TIGR01451 family)